MLENHKGLKNHCFRHYLGHLFYLLCKSRDISLSKPLFHATFLTYGLIDELVSIGMALWGSGRKWPGEVAVRYVGLENQGFRANSGSNGGNNRI